MIENEEKQLLDEIMKDSSPVLFLGAGFSKGSKIRLMVKAYGILS